MLVNNKLLFALLVSSATLALVQADTTDDAPPPKPKPKPSPGSGSGSGKGDTNDGDDASGGDDAVHVPNYCEVNSFDNFQTCGTNGLDQRSRCNLDVEGGYRCYADAYCNIIEARLCTTNSDCGEGWACSSFCRDGPGCAPLCTNQDGPFYPFIDDAPYYDDHADDFCYPPDYVASGEVPLNEKIGSGDAETAYSYAMKERAAESSLTHSNTVADELSSLITPLNVALLVAAVVLAVALAVFRVSSSSSQNQQQFTELSSSSEHSTHPNIKAAEAELERVSSSFDSSMKL